MKRSDIVGNTYVVPNGAESAVADSALGDSSQTNPRGYRFEVTAISNDTVKMKRNGKLVTVSWKDLKEDIMNGTIKPS